MAIHSNTPAWRIPVDGGAWQATVYGVEKSQIQLRTAHINFLDLINLILAVLVLHCCTLAFSSCGEQGLLSSYGAWASHTVASPVVQRRLQARRLQYLWHRGSVVVA